MRPIRTEEMAILECLLGMIPSHERPCSDYEIFVTDMQDGGMGSIYFDNKSDQSRKMGRELVTAEYIDEDQIPVLISINLDEDGQLFELDFWKVNYQPLKRYPTPAELHTAPPAATSSLIRP